MRFRGLSKKAILYGEGRVTFRWKNREITREWIGVVRIAHDMFIDEKNLHDFMVEKSCDSCNGHRLNPRSLAVRVGDKSIADIIDMPIEKSYKYFSKKSNFEFLTDTTKTNCKTNLKRDRG